MTCAAAPFGRSGSRDRTQQSHRALPIGFFVYRQVGTHWHLICWRSDVRCLCVRGYVALPLNVLDAGSSRHSRRPPCQSRDPREGVPFGGDPEAGGMRGPSPSAEFAEPDFGRRRNPFRDRRKLFLRGVPSAMRTPRGTTGLAGLSSHWGQETSFDPSCSLI